MGKYDGHTPGPWEHWKFAVGTHVTSSAHGHVAEMQLMRGGKIIRDEEIEANAKLIADAPMLAEQNERMLDFIMACRYAGEGGLSMLREDAKQIIAEVEGSRE